MSQKRDAYRLEMSFPARYIPYAEYLAEEREEPADSEQAASGWQNGVIRDLSAGGLKLSGALQIPPNGELVVRVTLPSEFLHEMQVAHDIEEISPFGTRVRSVIEEPEPFDEMNLRSRVVSVAFDSQIRQFVHHIAFVDMKLSERNDIARFINLQQRYRLQRRAGA